MLSRREQKELRALRLRKHRQEQGLFLVEGVRAVEDLLASTLTVRWVAGSSTLEDGERGAELLHRIAANGLPFRSVPDAELREHAATDTPQGVIAVAEIPRCTLDDLRPSADPAAVLVLDAVQDPGNLGTLVRTAEALGASGAIALPGTVDAWNPKAVRAAMGSSFRLPVVEAAWEDAAPWLRDNGFRILAAAASGDPLGEPRPPRSALVLGNEGAGVSAATFAHADATVGIPIRGRAESLNVAAAGAILLHELLR
ncbi:MAG TPA: RNA methyltransferase [Longimicrobiaceae bacterium]|jgi:TrmH family RNA methyltransferase|nr:RNA methyltransferase [Longimicrobiaceae bacterium]